MLGEFFVTDPGIPVPSGKTSFGKLPPIQGNFHRTSQIAPLEEINANLL
jgi:hypothetical protein